MRCDAIYILHILYVYTEDMYINVFYMYIYIKENQENPIYHSIRIYNIKTVTLWFR